MIIYNPDDTVLLNIEVDDSSAAYAEVMSRDDVTLEFSLAEHIEIPIGAYIEFGGREFQLLVPATTTVVNRRNYHYSAVFETDAAKTRLWRIHNPVDGRVKFELTARPSEHLAMFVENLNEREGINLWAVAPGSYDSEEVTLSYNRTTIRDGINQLAERCETEWEVYRDGGTVYLSLGKVEYNADSPLSLSYGDEGGFESGVKRTNDGEGLPIQILYVNGGERNIDPSTYYNRSHYLLLPRSYSFSFDGEKFNGESGYDATKGVAMTTDQYGYSVKLASAPRGAAEETLDLSDIYPKRVGTVSAVTTHPSKGDYPYYNIEDDTLGTGSGKTNIDFNALMIDGETFTIVFQSGMLVGREIGVHKYTLASGKGIFELSQETIDGFIMPGEGGYVPAVGDTYAVFGCALPSAYIADAANHGGAEFEMLRKAAKYLYENKDAKQSFKGVLSSVFARKNWATIGPKIVLGGYTLFTDDAVRPEPVSMRIKSIKTYINKPYKPEIEMSTEMSRGTVGGSIQSLRNNYAHTDRQFYDAHGFTNRRWRDAMEGQDLLAEAIEALDDDFTEGISPVTIRTMSALVGSTNLQYEIYTSDAYTTLQSEPYFNASGNLVCPAGYVKHYTLGFDESNFVKSSRPNSEYYRWSLSSATLVPTEQGAYYLYIAASKITTPSQGTATYLLSRTPIPFAPTSGGSNYDANHYYLLYATISSEVEGSRSIATYNGFTEITPGMIRAMKWISNDGYQFIDFISKGFRIGDASKFLGYNLGANGEYDGQGRLRLKGTLVQSPSGDTFPSPCNRGEYDADTPYFYGDQVTYNGESWLYINETSTTGTTPTEGSYWHKTAAKGATGSGEVAIFRWDSNATTAPAVPTSKNYPPASTTGWYASAPSRPQTGENYLWMSTGILSGSAVDAWTTPVRISGDKGTPGEDADDREWIYNYSNTGYDGNTGEVSPGGTASGSDTNKNQDDWVPNGWSDSPAGVSDSHKTEYASWRDITVSGTTKTYGAFHAPIVWSHYGERGMDGDGVEYVYIRTTTNVAPSIIVKSDSYKDSNNHAYTDDDFLPVAQGGSLSSETECTDDPQGVSDSYPYEWVAKRTKPLNNDGVTRTWEKYSGTMALWSKYSKDGDPGAAGKIMRGRSEWNTSGYGGSNKYQGRDEYDNGDKYIDIVLYTNPSTGESLTYLCKKSHNPASITPLNTTYWEEMSNYSMIATSALYAENALIENLGATRLNTDTDGVGYGVNIESNEIKVTNSNGNTALIKGGNGFDSADTSGSISGTGTSKTGTKSGSGTVTQSVNCITGVSVASGSNSVTISQFTCNISVPQGHQYYDCSIIAKLVSTGGDVIEIASKNGMNRSIMTFVVPQSKLSVKAGTWSLVVEFVANFGQTSLTMGYDVGATSISGSYKSTANGTQLVGDGFKSAFGGEGFKATSSGAKVIRGYSEKNAVASSTGKGFEFVLPGESYPSDANMEDGVFYIKLKQAVS